MIWNYCWSSRLGGASPAEATFRAVELSVPSVASPQSGGKGNFLQPNSPKELQTSTKTQRSSPKAIWLIGYHSYICIDALMIYHLTSAQGLLRNVTLKVHLRGWITIPRIPSKKKWNSTGWFCPPYRCRDIYTYISIHTYIYIQLYYIIYIESIYIYICCLPFLTTFFLARLWFQIEVGTLRHRNARNLRVRATKSKMDCLLL